MSSIKTPSVIKISAYQCMSVVCTAGLVAGIWDRVAVLSLVLGGMISIIPNAYFAHRVFRDSGARMMEKVVRNFFLAEVVKLVLAGTGFALVFSRVKSVEEVFLFAGFLVAHLVGLVVQARLLAGYRQQA
jgi:ATP synthase protein I